MKKKYLKIIFYLLMLLFTVVYIYYFKPITDDELYNYGFSYNIINGLVPYRDFNMIIPPLFSYLLAVVLKIFGSKLIVYHVVIAIIIMTIFHFCYISIGKTAFIIYLLLFVYPYIGYNMFSLMLLFILFYIGDKKIKNLDIVEACLISLMLLTKQTLGLLVIPSLIFSKNRKKSLIVYLIFLFSFLIYLVANDTVYQFFDYCLFGLFDFANKNSTGMSLFTIVEIIIIISLAYFSFVTKRKDIFFCLMFQVMTLPIINYFHFIISFIPVVYLILKKYKDNKYVLWFGMAWVVSFFLSFSFVIRFAGDGFDSVEYYDIDNFMEGRATNSVMDNYILNVSKYIYEYDDYRIYVFGRLAYLTKLNFDLTIDKYDIINNGNMGYNGAVKYMREVDNYCCLNKCLFIIDDQEDSISPTIQTNVEILDYVKDNYRSIYSSNIFSIYTN